VRRLQSEPLWLLWPSLMEGGGTGIERGSGEAALKHGHGTEPVSRSFFKDPLDRVNEASRMSRFRRCPRGARKGSESESESESE